MARLSLVFALLSTCLMSANSHVVRETSKSSGAKSLAAVESSIVQHDPKEAGNGKAAAEFFAKFVGLDEATLENNVPFEEIEEDESYDGLSNFITDDMMGEGGMDEEKDGKPAKPKGLTLGPATIDYGEVVDRVRSSKEDDLFDLFGKGLSTASLSTGAEVNLLLDDTSSKSEGTVRMFKKDGSTNRTCSYTDTTKIVTAKCGNHYLFPGHTMRLGSTSKVCSWNFRHSSPELILSLKGSQLQEDFDFEIKERIVPISLKELPDESERSLKATGKIYKDLVITTRGIASPGPGQIDAEVCVPSAPDNHLAEYEAFGATCCSDNNNCGVASVGNLVGKKLTMHALPWEAVLTVKGNRHSDTEEGYCSGSLISRDWMLTTASCFIRHGVIDSGDRDFVPEVEVSFGLENDSYPVETHSISEIHVFPTATESHDIALVRLKERSSRMPVCLPGFTKPNPVHTLLHRNAIVFGWIVDIKPVYMSGLRQNVIGSDACSVRMGERLPPHMICTEDVPEDRPCLPDGDLLIGNRNKYVLAGLSYPRLKCVHDLRPHTSVSYFMKWISNVTGISLPRNPPF